MRSQLCGKRYILEKNFAAALVDFEKALVLHNEKFPPSDAHEPPELLYATIEWLKKQK
jgi:hypothetical protein